MSSTNIASIDLSGPFATRSAWRLDASQLPPTDDTFGSTNDKVPGAIDVCLHRGASGPCDPNLQGMLRTALAADPFNEPHYLNTARIVQAGRASRRPLLLVQTASEHSGDGDQIVLTQALAYDRTLDRFVRIYDHVTGRNNNQEVRYVTAGPLAGDIVAVEPTEDAPFGFWVTVDALTPSTTYKVVLRYRSATTYADGNPLAVIDSEMADIQQRLGLWRPGTKPPLPATPCPRPHLVHMELWCG